MNKKAMFLAIVLAATFSAAKAETIGVSIPVYEDRFLTTLLNAMTEYAALKGNVELLVEDPRNDLGMQLQNIQKFIDDEVDAIIVTVSDSDAGRSISNMADDAGIPLVFVNRAPNNVDDLPYGQVFVASNEIESGTLSAFEVCKKLRSGGKAGGADVIVLMGSLNNQAAVKRTQDIKDVVGMAMCKFMDIVEAQTANWSRTEAKDLVAHWINSGVEFDAVLANNDEMAIGAIEAIKAAGIDLDDVIVGGVDATDAALAAMREGELEVTVFQDGKGQGTSALDTALKLIEEEDVDKQVYVPFKLVTTENMDDL